MCVCWVGRVSNNHRRFPHLPATLQGGRSRTRGRICFLPLKNLAILLDRHWGCDVVLGYFVPWSFDRQNWLELWLGASVG